MNNLTDQQLLGDYAGRRSEPAFAELVRRHIDFVHSAALRMVRDSHLAQDVTQGVFMALAQNARQLADRPVLSGWLHRTAQNLASKTVRTDVRRRAREQEAAAMNELPAAESDAAWENVAPHLDAALGELAEPDRDAVLLRYFERKSAREMALTLGVSEDTAQKRVTRAVERLREFFTKRGVTIGAGGLVVLISANSAQAAPVGLAVAITAAAVAATAVTTTTIATHATMNWINAKLITAVLASAVAAGTATHLLQQSETDSLRRHNQNLAVERDSLAKERDAAVSTADRSQATARTQPDQGELLRLRSEVGTLRGLKNELDHLREENRQLRTQIAAVPAQSTAAAPQNHFPKETWAFAGYATPEAAIKTWVWAMGAGDKKTMLASLVPEEVANFSKVLDEVNGADWARQNPFNAFNLVARQDVSADEVVLTLVSDFPDGRHTQEQKMKVQKVGGEWKIAGEAE